MTTEADDYLAILDELNQALPCFGPTPFQVWRFVNESTLAVLERHRPDEAARRRKLPHNIHLEPPIQKRYRDEA